MPLKNDSRDGYSFIELSIPRPKSSRLSAYLFFLGFLSKGDFDLTLNLILF